MGNELLNVKTSIEIKTRRSMEKERKSIEKNKLTDFEFFETFYFQLNKTEELKRIDNIFYEFINKDWNEMNWKTIQLFYQIFKTPFSKEKFSKELIEETFIQLSIKENDSKELNSKEIDSKEGDSKEKDSKEKEKESKDSKEYKKLLEYHKKCSNQIKLTKCLYKMFLSTIDCYYALNKLFNKESEMIPIINYSYDKYFLSVNLIEFNEKFFEFKLNVKKVKSPILIHLLSCIQKYFII